MPWPPLASQVLRRLRCCEGENLWEGCLAAAISSRRASVSANRRNPGSLCLYRLTDDSKDRINERTISCGLKLTTFSGRAKDRCNAEISSEKATSDSKENHHASPTSSVCHNGRLKRNGRRSLGKDRAGDSGARGAFGSWPLMCARRRVGRGRTHSLDTASLTSVLICGDVLS
jgi:hypothetical protein